MCLITQGLNSLVGNDIEFETVSWYYKGTLLGTKIDECEGDTTVYRIQVDRLEQEWVVKRETTYVEKSAHFEQTHYPTVRGTITRTPKKDPSPAQTIDASSARCFVLDSVDPRWKNRPLSAPFTKALHRALPFVYCSQRWYWLQ